MKSRHDIHWWVFTVCGVISVGGFLLGIIIGLSKMFLDMRKEIGNRNADYSYHGDYPGNTFSDGEKSPCKIK